ncbi:MarR family winged helix-turn-helix transcriptional regulator [Neotabrizicola shimadae]|uniref:MarR family transcriptional regulator n=1 Tax=Neotabrizicola shimadae TaxID=2807096 RepID=A0A8G0ZVV1_9RHOB|nr:MarR family transcriptional regulator [Neotabrizicola shimadae]QYZ69615.1 MarR family transcriptional regulator [Neotabrizicola shimadae]
MTQTHTDRIDDLDQDLSVFLGYEMKRALSLIQADLARVLGELGLRAVSFSALTVIVQTPGLTQSALADALQIERSNLVTLIDELSERNLIVRAPVAGDRRRHALMPTAEGQRLARVAGAAVAAHEDRLFAGLTEEERRELQRLLAKFRRTA